MSKKSLKLNVTCQEPEKISTCDGKVWLACREISVYGCGLDEEEARQNLLENVEEWTKYVLNTNKKMKNKSLKESLARFLNVSENEVSDIVEEYKKVGEVRMTSCYA